MITIQKSNDVDLISSFMRGDGVVRRLAGGFDVSGVDIRRSVESSKDTFLVAFDDEKPVGFIALRPEDRGGLSIHLCLKTLGSKTRDAFRMAIDFARDNLGASLILAAYPESYRAVKLLLSEFGFQDESPWFETPIPYKFQNLSV